MFIILVRTFVNMDNSVLIQDYLDSQIKCISELRNTSYNIISEISEILINARDNGNKIYIMGNGGSASTATHFTSDLLKTSLTKNTKRFKAFSLSDNIPVVLAWANDSSYDNVFVGQLESLLEQNDVIIGISGSGNSTNVIKAIEYANKINAKTISLTGKSGGKMAKIAKINLTVPNNDMLTIESIHLLVCHLLTTLIRSKGEPLFTY